MSFGGRELSAAEALAAKASNDADATAMRHAGLSGSLRELRVQALLDRITGRDPLHRATTQATGTGAATPATGTSDPTQGTGTSDPAPGTGASDPAPGTGAPSAPGSPAGSPAPLPAVINLTIPAGTLFGWSTTPGDAGTWGLLDPGDTRDIVAAASRHPATRWRVTVLNPDGTAAAHGRARGPHAWTPPPPGTGMPKPNGPGPPPGPDAHQQAQLASLLRALNVTLSPIAAGTCDHRHREDRYTPSRKLKDLVRARTATCSAPGCGAQAAYSDLDHTLAYPDGVTCECNLSPPCRHHHRVKQAPGWHLDQPAPGVMRWTTPSGRVHTTTPTVYDL